MVQLDELDRKILYELDINSKQSNKEIAKKIMSNKDTVNYRIQKLIDRHIITRYTVEINTAYLGYENIKVYLQFQNMNKKVEKEFFDYLKKNHKVGWIVKSSGKWDALFCYWAKSKFDFYKEFRKILDKYSEYIYSKEVIHNINWFYFNRKWLNPTALKVSSIKYGELPHYEKIDHLDKAIINRLIENPKVPINKLALDLKTSSQNIINRIKKLQQKQIITKFGIDLNYNKMNLMFCKTFLYLGNFDEERVKELYNYCSKEPNVFALTTCLGAWDVELEFEVSKFEEVIRIMDDLKEKFGDILRNYESIIIGDQSEVIYVGD